MTRVALALLLAGCHASFVDERAAGDAPAAGIDGANLGPGLLVATGRFIGRAGHVAAGGVELYDHEGTTEVRFLPDFSISDVPGPVVVLTPRDSLGIAIDPVAGDLSVAPLRTPMGAQSYFANAGGLPPTSVFVFCMPYGLEVGKAPLGGPDR